MNTRVAGKEKFFVHASYLASVSTPSQVCFTFNPNRRNMESMHQKETPNYFAIGIAMGIPLGMPVALAVHNLALGPLFGIVLGIVLGLVLRYAANRDKKSGSKPNSYRLLIISLLVGIVVLVELLIHVFGNSVTDFI